MKLCSFVELKKYILVIYLCSQCDPVRGITEGDHCRALGWSDFRCHVIADPIGELISDADPNERGHYRPITLRSYCAPHVTFRINAGRGSLALSRVEECDVRDGREKEERGQLR